MRIVLVGASGFFGRFLLNRLVDDGHHCVVLTRAAGRHGNLGLMRNVELVQADVYDAEVLAARFKGADAVVSMAGILNESGGGGKGFPASTTSFEQKLNKKMYKAGMRSIVSELLRSGRMSVVEAIEVQEIKTRAVADQLKAMGKTDVLIVSDNPSEALLLSARNIKNVEVTDLTGLNPYSLLQHTDIIITADAAGKLEELLA